MKFLLASAIALNIILSALLFSLAYFNYTTTIHIEKLSQDIRDTYSENNALYQRFSVIAGQVERDIIRIRNYSKKGK